MNIEIERMENFYSHPMIKDNSRFKEIVNSLVGKTNKLSDSELEEILYRKLGYEFFYDLFLGKDFIYPKGDICNGSFYAIGDQASFKNLSDLQIEFLNRWSILYQVDTTTVTLPLVEFEFSDLVSCVSSPKASRYTEYKKFIEDRNLKNTSPLIHLES